MDYDYTAQEYEIPCWSWKSSKYDRTPIRNHAIGTRNSLLPSQSY